MNEWWNLPYVVLLFIIIVYFSQKILYAWARDAPRLDLPSGVGFKVGKNSQTKYLVLQVHYAHVDQFKGMVIYTKKYIFNCFKLNCYCFT